MTLLNYFHSKLNVLKILSIKFSSNVRLDSTRYSLAVLTTKTGKSVKMRRVWKLFGRDPRALAPLRR